MMNSMDHVLKNCGLPGPRVNQAKNVDNALRLFEIKYLGVQKPQGG
jgi:hypothetical protein